MYMGHYVVAQLFLPLGGPLVVDVRDVGLQLVHLLLGHRQAQFHLRPGQGHPQAAPGGEFLVSGKQVQHLIAGVAGGQRTFILVSRHCASSLSVWFLRRPSGREKYLNLIIPDG